MWMRKNFRPLNKINPLHKTTSSLFLSFQSSSLFCSLRQLSTCSDSKPIHNTFHPKIICKSQIICIRGISITQLHLLQLLLPLIFAAHPFHTPFLTRPTWKSNTISGTAKLVPTSMAELMKKDISLKDTSLSMENALMNKLQKEKAYFTTGMKSTKPFQKLLKANVLYQTGRPSVMIFSIRLPVPANTLRESIAVQDPFATIQESSSCTDVQSRTLVPLKTST